jgi:hypothetical protein
MNSSNVAVCVAACSGLTPNFDSSGNVYLLMYNLFNVAVVSSV